MIIGYHFKNNELSNVFYYQLVVCAIAMENPTNKWWFLAGKIIYFD